MQKAAEMAPNLARLRLNLAWIEEQAGELEAASALYRQLICQAPGLTDSLFFQGTDLRQSLAQTGCQERDTNSGGDPFQSSLEEGKLALRDGDLGRAEQALIRAQQANPQHPDSYAYLGLVHQQAGQPEQARREVQTALYLSPASITALLNAAQVAEDQGFLDISRQYLWNAFQLLSAPLPSLNYYAHLYSLPPLPSELSPYLMWEAPTQELLDTFEKLAADFNNTGQFEESRQLREWVEVQRSR
jgi:tetratricopeptide (TPR) repeat protein